jgi:hypothetical protein
MTTSEILIEIATTICPDGPNVPETKIRLRNGVVSLADDVQQGDRLFIYKQENGLATLNEIFSMTAEEWLNSQGVGGVRQPTLLYLRQSLTAASKESPLLNSLEAYLQTILSIYATDPNPRYDWPLPPTTFEAAVHEAVTQLNS